LTPTNDKPTRPLLRYHGGKWLLAPWIIAHLPPHRVYVEPFCGAASVLLRKRRSFSEVINDLDDEIVNLFRMVRDRGEELREALRLTPFARAEYAAAMGLSGEPLEDARRLVIRAFMGFGSDAHNVCRRSGFMANANRNCTAPVHDWCNFPDALTAIICRLRGVVIEHRPALAIIAQQDSEETVFYCDPPYVHETRSPQAHSPHCYAHEMTDAEHVEVLDALKGVRGMVVLSGYDSALYAEHVGHWRQVRRRALADGARERTEVLWLNPSAAERLGGRLF
jgi:DNA adenine methylase